jgi:DNA-binding LacI/PurR family transcriptional regulator
LPGHKTSLDFDFSEFSVVGLGTSVSRPAIDRIADDHFYAAKLAYEKCHALGYRRIGLSLPASISQRLEHRWWSGYLVAQKQATPRVAIPALMPETRDEIPPLLNGWISRHRLDAVIFALRDEARMGCAPPHVGLVSLSVHQIDGQVAGIKQDSVDVGAGAIDMLVEKLNRWEIGPAAKPRLQLIRGRWTEGASAPGAGHNRTALIASSP